MQPDAKAEKGDSKPVNKVHQMQLQLKVGKGEVVKPEENPVDKAVALSKESRERTKEVSGDASTEG